jgi:hypothetical protein
VLLPCGPCARLVYSGDIISIWLLEMYLFFILFSRGAYCATVRFFGMIGELHFKIWGVNTSYGVFQLLGFVEEDFIMSAF